MIDTHAHIYLPQFDEDREDIISTAQTLGVEKILLPNIDRSSIDAMLQVEEEHPNVCFSMMGLHPCSVKEDFEEELALVEEWLNRRPFIALGEIGTDLYWDKTFFSHQKEAFNIQCEWALAREMPVVIHCRESIDETIALVEPFATSGLTGVFHCFTGDSRQAQQITEMGFLLGIGGVATFKNGGLDRVLPHLSPDHLLLETDSPYLAPVPHRGKRNEPAYVRLVAEKVSAYLDGLGVKALDEMTTQNAINLFKLGQEE
ncbi:MAG: TatD family hydrolase [Bacteroidota bacterium]